MSDELVAPQEVSDPDSLRDVLLFCGVLLVEIYSLSVAFGGPFLEVGYFLLVVISQTTAGAYIWAKLREHERILPLPELLAMGFAIGSASAAISQLIIRDLLGIRMFVSPLVPIIAVFVWRTFKKNPQLPVQISHAKTNTLLWLLFPAPLAISFFIWELYAVFILPLFLFAFLAHKFKIKSIFLIALFVSAISGLFALVLRATSKISIALAFAGNDELFDEGHAIGFANWGLNENIGQVGTSFSYYKLSHVWLGPILELTRASPMRISTTVMTLVIFTIIGLAFWSTSYRLFHSSTIAGLTAVFLFAQHSLPEPFALNIRLAQSFVIIFLVCGITVFLISWQSYYHELIATSAVVFLIFSTRAQYGMILILGICLQDVYLLVRRKLSLQKFVLKLSAVTVATIFVFLIFFNQSQVGNEPGLPISKLKLLDLLIGGLIVRTIIPLVATHKQVTVRNSVIFTTVFSAVVIFFVIPQSTLGEAPTLAIVLLSSFFIANEFVKISQVLRKFVLISFVLGATIVGAALRIIYDAYKWEDISLWDKSSGGYKSVKYLAKISTNGDYSTRYALFAFIAVLLIAVLVQRATHSFNRIRATIVALAVGMSLGVSIASIFRTVTGHYRYEMILTRDLGYDSPLIWLTDPERVEALTWIKNNTRRDAIFAQNTSLLNTNFDASLLMSTFTHRRAYLEAPHFGATDDDDKLTRRDTSLNFPVAPSDSKLENLKIDKVNWFIVDLANTPLRNWEPWATIRFANNKVAILKLAAEIES